MQKIKITNPELFYSKKVEVEASALYVGETQADGDVTIYAIEDGEEIEVSASGEFGLRCYEDQFGFVFTANA